TGGGAAALEMAGVWGGGARRGPRAPGGAFPPPPGGAGAGGGGRRHRWTHPGPASTSDSALAPQQSAADLQQVAEAEFAVAVLVEHRAQQPAAEAALLADLLLFTAQDRAQRLGIGRLRLALALEHLAGEEGQHDRREDAHQLPGLVVAQAGGLAEAGLRARQLATEHVAEDAGAGGLPRLRAAEHGAEQAAEVAGAGEILLQCAEQRLGPLRLAGIAAERAEQQGQRGAHGGGGLVLPGAQLLRDLLQRRALELLEQLLGQGTGHRTSPGTRALRGAPTVALRSARKAPGVLVPGTGRRRRAGAGGALRGRTIGPAPPPAARSPPGTPGSGSGQGLEPVQRLQRLFRGQRGGIDRRQRVERGRGRLEQPELLRLLDPLR